MKHKTKLQIFFLFAVITIFLAAKPTEPESTENPPLILRFLCTDEKDLTRDLSAFTRRVQKVLKTGYKLDFDRNTARVLFLKNMPSNDQIEELTNSGLIEVFENLTVQNSPEIKEKIQIINALNLSLVHMQEKNNVYDILWELQAFMQLPPKYDLSIDFSYSTHRKIWFKEAQEIFVYKKPALITSDDIEKLELFKSPNTDFELRPFGLSVTLNPAASKKMEDFYKAKRGEKIIIHVNGEHEVAPMVLDPSVTKKFLISRIARAQEYYQMIIRNHYHSVYHCPVLQPPQ